MLLDIVIRETKDVIEPVVTGGKPMIIPIVAVVVVAIVVVVLSRTVIKRELDNAQKV